MYFFQIVLYSVDKHRCFGYSDCVVVLCVFDMVVAKHFYVCAGTYMHYTFAGN